MMHFEESTKFIMVSFEMRIEKQGKAYILTSFVILDQKIYYACKVITST